MHKHRTSILKRVAVRRKAGRLGRWNPRYRDWRRISPLYTVSLTEKTPKRGS